MTVRTLRLVPGPTAVTILVTGVFLGPLSTSGAATGPAPGALLASTTTAAVHGGALPGTAARRLDPGTVRSPRSFTGFAFDRCVTPSSTDMDTWRRTSPFAAVGIYISGAGRACPAAAQPYLDPRWVARQHQRGWRLLPIHVGLQAPCFQQGDPTPTKPRMASGTGKAHRQGVSAAGASVAKAQHFGLGRGSTLYLDIEWYDRTIRSCNRAVLAHVDGWTERVHELGYRSGLYSSASAAIQAVDVARTRDRSRYDWPDQLWFAWGNGKADLEGEPYLSDRFWQGHRRLHQYQLDTVATYGGTSLAIDRNWMSVGKGSRPPRERGTCGGRLSFRSYTALDRGAAGRRVSAARCLLQRHGWSDAEVTRTFDRRTTRALKRMQRASGLPVSGRLTARSWTALLSAGPTSLVKVGSDLPSVWRLQRTLRATGGRTPVTGVFGRATADAVAAYERRLGLPVNGVADGRVWRRLSRGVVARG